MRVLYLMPAEAFGGAERQGVVHLRNLGKYGVDVVSLVGPGEPIRRELRRAGVNDYVYAADFPRSTHSKLSLLGNLRYGAGYLRSYLRSIDLVSRTARDCGADVIFANRSFSWALAAPVSRQLGLPYIVRAGSRPTHALARGAVRALCWRWGRPAALVSNCQAIHDDFSPLFRCPGRVIPNAVDCRRFRPGSASPAYRTRGDVASGTPVIGLAARPAPEKGLEFLAQVIKHVTKRVKSLSLLIAGEYGWRSYYETLFRKVGVGQYVRFLGHVDKMEQFYESCDLVVLTSRKRSIEGSPNALLEAMAMGRPVVATRVGGVAEIVRDGVEGFTVAPSDAQCFANQVIRLVENPALRGRLGAAGRKRIVQRFGEQAVMEALVDTILSVSGEKPSSYPQTRLRPVDFAS